MDDMLRNAGGGIGNPTAQMRDAPSRQAMIGEKPAMREHPAFS